MVLPRQAKMWVPFSYLESRVCETFARAERSRWLQARSFRSSLMRAPRLMDSVGFLGVFESFMEWHDAMVRNKQVPLGALMRIAHALALPVDALLPDMGDMPRDPRDAELLARLRSLMALGPEEKAVACSLLDTVLAMRQISAAWRKGAPHATRDER